MWGHPNELSSPNEGRSSALTHQYPPSPIPLLSLSLFLSLRNPTFTFTLLTTAIAKNEYAGFFHERRRPLAPVHRAMYLLTEFKQKEILFTPSLLFTPSEPQPTPPLQR